MEPPLAPDSDEDRIATAEELLWLAERYLERGDSSRAATTVSIAEDVIEALIHESDSARGLPRGCLRYD
jgi:hypothetical protein